MPKQPLISVIVPIYNIAAYLPRCIDSITRQTYQNLEIILVDDGSTDTCPHICDEYAAKDKRIKVIHQQNKGLPSARNAGMEQMHGEFFAFVDADDWIDKTCYEQLMQCQQQTQADLVRCPHYLVYDTHKVISSTVKNSPQGFLSPAKFLFSLLQQKDMIACNKIYRRKWVADTRLDPRYSVCEDTFFVSQLAKKGGCLAQVNNPLYFYYQRPNSMQRTSNSRSWYLAMCLWADLYNDFKQDPFVPVRTALLDYLLTFTGSFAMLALLEKQSKSEYITQARQILRSHVPQILRDKLMRSAGKLFALSFVYLPRLTAWGCALPGLNGLLLKIFSKTR